MGSAIASTRMFGSSSLGRHPADMVYQEFAVSRVWEGVGMPVDDAAPAAFNEPAVRLYRKLGFRDRT